MLTRPITGLIGYGSSPTRLPKMNNSSIGKLERVPLREVWKHEAQDFTQWLQENIDILNDVLDLSLVNVEREQAAGAFSVDLVAEDEGGGTVIIENQLEKSNHDHLGKLITYLTAMQAKVAIWIVSDPRPEHIAAITWLNESGSAEFYMLKLEAVKIDASPAAPLFTLIVGPSEEGRIVGKVKEQLADRHYERKAWWTALIKRSALVNKLHAHICPSFHGEIGASSGVPGLSFKYVIRRNWWMVELYIGKNSYEENKAIFDQLAEHRTEIEQAFLNPLSWDRLDQKCACRICFGDKTGGYRSPEGEWPKLQDTAIRAMDRLEKALRSHLSQLRPAT